MRARPARELRRRARTLSEAAPTGGGLDMRPVSVAPRPRGRRANESPRDRRRATAHSEERPTPAPGPAQCSPR